MKKIWICLLLALLTGCGTPTEEAAFSGSVFTSAEEVYAVDLEETYPESLGKGGKNYRNLEALAGDADAVVLGCAMSVKKNGSGIATEFVVQESWQGSPWKGALITVCEKGGIPPMEPDRTYLLFLQGEYPEYSLCGAVQGRFVERNGYLFQQTWKNRKIPETPARTGNMESMVSMLVPSKTCGPYGVPRILRFENVEALQLFITAVETPESCAQWIEDNQNIHAGVLYNYEDALDIVEKLKNVPFPAIVEELELPVHVYPEYGWEHVEITNRDGEKNCQITISFEKKTVDVGRYGRQVEADNFRVLYDRTDVLSDQNSRRIYVGQVDGHRVSVDLRKYEPEEALRFVKSLEFETLSEENKAN